ncbi:MAG: DUF4249 family protein [Lewinellaceae bacterium]|nr:DUF4249 family protein [Saprospiraceae bacterium]MCB9307669.1 DUF4249 family protein [Lewinellaceae bacterium]MCB9353937.1 DUF4249 family protein [Lewinellaceae bacterium]
MKNGNKFILKLILISSFFFVQCAREVFIDLPEEETKIVATCHFTVGQPFKVMISLSQQIYDSGDPIIPAKADITLAKEGAFIDKLFRAVSDNGEIYWESRDLAEPGVPYSFIARVDDLKQVTGQSSIPAFYPLAPIEINPESITETSLSDGRLMLTVPLELRLDELPADKPYFAFSLKHDTDVLQNVGGQWVTDYTYEGLPTNYSADGRTLSLLYDLSEPVVLVNEKFWNDQNNTLYLDAKIPYNPAENERPRRLYVEWRTLSEEFYRYHLSIARQGSTLPLSDPDAVFNNIENGYGNFSGYSVSVDTIALP